MASAISRGAVQDYYISLRGETFTYSLGVLEAGVTNFAVQGCSCTKLSKYVFQFVARDFFLLSLTIES